MDVLLTDNLLRKSGFPLGPFHENRTALEHCLDCWGVLRVPGDFFEPIRRELKIPRRDLCLLSGKTERRGLRGLSAVVVKIQKYLEWIESIESKFP